MKAFKVIALIAPFTLTSGCSFLFGDDGLFPDNSNRYKEAPELAEIVVPPSLGVPK